MKVLLTGATGFVGSHLARCLVTAGHQVLPVSRRALQGVEGLEGAFEWSDVSLRRGVEEADAVVHLAGENLFSRRWNAKQKAALRSSRVETGARLAALAAELKPGCLVSASAVGYYGASDIQGLDESSPQGSDFLATLCADWEATMEPARTAGVRLVTLRIGVVLGQGGALEKMMPPFKLGLGGPLGSGRQWVSWIHVHDLAAMILFFLERPETAGIYNGTAPNPVTNRQLSKALGKALHRPALFPAPGPLLRLALGEGATVLLTGQHVVPGRALEAGFEFRFNEIDDALTDLLG